MRISRRGSPSACHSGTGAGSSEPDLQVARLYRRAEEGSRDALALGPRNLRRVAREAGRVALAEDLPGVDDDQRARVVLALGHRPVERRLQRRHVDFGGRRIVVRADVARRPLGHLRIGAASLDDARLVGHILESGRENRAPLVAVVLGGLPVDALSPHRGRPCLEVHGILEVVLPFEDVEAPNILCHDLLDRAFVVAADYEHARTDVVGGHPGDVAAHMGRIRGAGLPDFGRVGPRGLDPLLRPTGGREEDGREDGQTPGWLTSAHANPHSVAPLDPAGPVRHFGPALSAGHP